MRAYGKRVFAVDELRNKLPNGIRQFSEGTSFHGFHELYHAKTFFWKLFWFLVCGSACVLTGYQVYRAIEQYAQATTTTLISPSQENDILYPPLSLCYWQWFYWVDWKKAMSLNYSREALLYGFSFYNTIYFYNEFDLHKAKDEFTTLMKAKNYATLAEFYLSVARDIPISADNNNFKLYFDERHIVFNDPYNMFCYKVSEQQMSNFFSQNQNDDGSVRQKIITFNTYDEAYANFSSHTTIEEYNYYMTAWAEKYSMYKVRAEKLSKNNSFEKFSPPKILILFSNIQKGAEIQVDSDAYQIDVQASVYSWQRKTGVACEDGKKSISSDDTCQNLCESEYEMSACSCQLIDKAFRVKNDTPRTVCNKGWISISNQSALQIPGSVQVCATHINLSLIYNKCMNSCLPACQIWNYEKTTTIKTSSNVLRSVGVKSSTTIRIEYPMGKDIINMIETDSQSWEDFIGNVGGLLGIWTGASILSFVQLFYLCFCADYEGCPTSNLLMDNILKSFKKPTKVIEIKGIQTSNVALKNS